MGENNKNTGRKAPDTKTEGTNETREPAAPPLSARQLKRVLRYSCICLRRQSKKILASDIKLANLPMFPNSDRPKLFPFELVVFMPILFLIAVNMMGKTAKSVEETLENSYKLSLEQADVICEQLAVYGTTSAFDCEKRLKSRGKNNGDSIVPEWVTGLFRWIGVTKQDGAASDANEAKRKPLYPNDLTTLMFAAGLIEEEEAAVPESILNVTDGSVATWIANAWISPCLVEGTRDLGGRKNEPPLVTLHYDGMAYSTIEAVLATVCKLGKKPSDACKDTKTDTEAEFGVCKQQVQEVVQKMAAGVPIQEILKSFMDNYDLNVEYKNGEKGAEPQRRPESGILTFAVKVTDNVNQPIYEATGPEVSIEKTPWGKENPWALREAAFKFSYYLLTQVSQASDVKTKRFVYKALVGDLQRAILLLIIFVGLVLITRMAITALAFLTPASQACGVKKWRLAYKAQEGDLLKSILLLIIFVGLVLITSLITTMIIMVLVFLVFLLWRTKTTAFLFWGFGNTKNLPKDIWETELESSGKVTGQLLDLLPLLGLFGTVIGILKGLPNAASVVVSSGPLGNEAVKALFEQLGLAFGTTAIALGGVIVLQPIWTVLQEMERRILIRLLA